MILHTFYSLAFAAHQLINECTNAYLSVLHAVLLSFICAYGSVHDRHSFTLESDIGHIKKKKKRQCEQSNKKIVSER